MNSKTSKSSIAALGLFAVAVIFRLFMGVAHQHAGWIPNFSPFAAIALCGAIYFPKRIAFALPIAALFVTDLILNAYNSAGFFSDGMITRYVALGLVAAIGFSLRSHPKVGTVMLASLGGSVLFYVLTNTGSWFGAPEYAKTFGGWLQALTVGRAGYPPTWVFFRNTFVSDMLFTATFVAAEFLTRESPLPRTLHARLKESACLTTSR